MDDHPEKGFDGTAPSIPGPFGTDIDPVWLDYNDHLNDAAYAQISARANEQLLVDLGTSAAYRAETGRAFYSARLTITYLRQISADDHVRVLRTISRLGRTSMVVTSTFQVGDYTAATTEHVYVMVDIHLGTATPISDDERSRIEILVGRTF